MKILSLLSLTLTVVLGCKGTGSSTSPAADLSLATPAADLAQPACPAAGPVEVTFDTDDGVALVADLYTPGKAGAPSAVLLHMIPPSNDRSNYPAEFIDALVAKGFAVLNVDRRGAGQSGGRATEAYVGAKGKLDAKAAQAYLLRHPCAPDPARMAFVGASNGTTTALDFAVLAATDMTVKRPAALVFLTGGSYTETNNTVAARRAALDPLPILFIFSNAEREWSEAQRGNSPLWRFYEKHPGGHGTDMFEVQPGTIAEVASYLAEVVR